MFYITQEDWDKVHAWAQLAYDEDKNEISGLMIAAPLDNGNWCLKEPDILKQKNSGVNTTLDGDAITKWVFDKKVEYKDKPHKYVWWHSHHMMAAEWSGTDDNEIEQWKNDNFTISLLINLKGDHKLRISYWEPVEVHEDIEVIVLGSPRQITDNMKKEYNSLCSNEVSVMNAGHHQGRLFNIVKPTKESYDQYALQNTFQNTIIDLDVMRDNCQQGIAEFKDWKKLCKEKNKELKEHGMPFLIDDKFFSGNKKIVNKNMKECDDLEDIFEFLNVEAEAACKDWYGGSHNGYY